MWTLVIGSWPPSGDEPEDVVAYRDGRGVVLDVGVYGGEFVCRVVAPGGLGWDAFPDLVTSDAAAVERWLTERGVLTRK
jgi:hypothetical protein